ncbi:hypothetical protein ScalyP_jg4013 [Parmales sp. scaly parma]|nr:hypothetical protein ScalyP_jg4013 [Parmales sp. scaly parma]
MADDEELYDEFGNYIGADLDSSDSDSDSDSDSESDSRHSVAEPLVEEDDYNSDGGNGNGNGNGMDVDDPSSSSSSLPNMGQSASVDVSTTNQIVLHEDKEHYPSASDIYGSSVNVATIDEDSQPLEKPIIEPLKTKNFSAIAPTKTAKPNIKGYSFRTPTSFTSSLMAASPSLTRMVSVVGHLHSGKTSLIDLLLNRELVDNDTENVPSFFSSSSLPASSGGGPRFTDTLLQEQRRQCGLKATPISFTLQTSRGKSHNLNLVDCPGHTAFHDETVAGLRVR